VLLSVVPSIDGFRRPFRVCSALTVLVPLLPAVFPMS
jgi:hypothetical protein